MAYAIDIGLSFPMTCIGGNDSIEAYYRVFGLFNGMSHFSALKMTVVEITSIISRFRNRTEQQYTASFPSDNNVDIMLHLLL